MAKFKLVMTCSACPEQYDVINGKGHVTGYLRLRHGHFRAHADGVGGPLVYEKQTIGDGCFDESERADELRNAIIELDRHYNGPRLKTSNLVDFEIVEI